MEKWKAPTAKGLQREKCDTAACLLTKRSLFMELGGFDESYQNGMEDVDLCMKMRSNGYRLIVSHQSVIRHHISRSPGRHRFNDENSELFRKRWSRRVSLRFAGLVSGIFSSLC